MKKVVFYLLGIPLIAGLFLYPLQFSGSPALHTFFDDAWILIGVWFFAHALSWLFRGHVIGLHPRAGTGYSDK